MRPLNYFKLAILSIFIHFHSISAIENLDKTYDTYDEAEDAGFPKNGTRGIYVSVGYTNIFQGWKIHVSATPNSMEKIFDIAAPILKTHDASFKYTTFNGLYYLNSAPQQQGKFITIYPDSLEQANAIAVALDANLNTAIENQVIDPETDFIDIINDAQLGNTKGLFARYGEYKNGLCRIVVPHSFLSKQDVLNCSSSCIKKDSRTSPLPEFASEWLDGPSPFPSITIQWSEHILWRKMT